MVFTALSLRGAFLIEPERHEDERGFFARTFCTAEFAAHGIKVPVVQCNVAYNRRRGTLRGLHYQRPPNEEAKLIRCPRGAIFDVIVDLRPESPTFKRWVAFELRADNGRMMWVPEGFAHGFQTGSAPRTIFDCPFFAFVMLPAAIAAGLAYLLREQQPHVTLNRIVRGHSAVGMETTEAVHR